MNSFGGTRESAQNKLILLYIIHKLALPVGYLQLIKIVLENRYMNYFQLQLSLNELERDGFLIKTVNGGRSAYKISESGTNTLNLLSSHLPAGIKASIEDMIKKKRKGIKEEIMVTADYIPLGETEYLVTCRADEDDFTLIKIEVAAGTKKDAKNICDNWKKHSHDIFAEIMESLSRNRD